jgi:RNA polymerase sigma-70 factor (ECF subfamily)
MIDRTEAACRQLAVRAREHVRQSPPRYSPDDTTRDALVEAFMAAAFGGNVAALAQLLAEDAVLYADGGGKRSAVADPIHGRANIMAFFARISTDRRAHIAPEQLERVDINALPGFIVRVADGPQTIAFDITESRISAIYVVRNPDKLRHLA